jgi:hypothetical protein
MRGQTMMVSLWLGSWVRKDHEIRMIAAGVNVKHLYVGHTEIEVGGIA